tara:strand:+ start:68 stop:673 length:606 start_codon:yes stop_codon:yes gene_type:complete
MKNKKNILNIIIDILSDEDKTKPYTDLEISKLLSKEGIKISRQNVNNYRRELGYPKSKDRVRFKSKQLNVGGFVTPTKPSFRAVKITKEYWYFYIYIAQRKDEKAIIYGMSSRPKMRIGEYNSKLKNGWKIDRNFKLYFGNNYDGVVAMGDKEKVREVEKWSKNNFNSYIDRKDLNVGFTENTKYSKEVLNKILWKAIEVI